MTRLMADAGITPQTTQVRSGGAELSRITGAQAPSGVPVVITPPPTAEARPARKNPARGGGSERGASQRGASQRGGAQRSGAQRGSSERGGSERGGTEQGGTASRPRRPAQGRRRSPAKGNGTGGR